MSNTIVSNNHVTEIIPISEMTTETHLPIMHNNNVTDEPSSPISAENEPQSAQSNDSLSICDRSASPIDISQRTQSATISTTVPTSQSIPAAFSSNPPKCVYVMRGLPGSGNISRSQNKKTSHCLDFEKRTELIDSSFSFMFSFSGKSFLAHSLIRDAQKHLETLLPLSSLILPHPSPYTMLIDGITFTNAVVCSADKFFL